GGYYIRDFGGSWGEFAQIVLIAGGSVLLVVFLASGDMRARLRVFLSKHFFSNKYDYREEWLRLTHSLADESDGLSPYQRAVRVAANIVGSPQGAVWLLREEGVFVPAGDWRLDVPADASVQADAPLVQFLAERKWIIDIDELSEDSERYGGLTLPESMTGRGRPWVIIPLLHQEALTGFILLTRPDVTTDINWEDRDLLKTLGRQLAGYLSLHENAQALSQARQFEAFNQLTAFLMHDLKNLIAQQSLVVKNAEKHKHNPEFIDDAMSTIGSSVARMERLLEHLQRSQRKGIVERVGVRHMLEDAVRRCSDRSPRPTLVVRGPDAFLEADPEEITMVVVHLVRNAQDATPDGGLISLEADIGADELQLTVEDSGEGMTPEFVRDELFKPFRTTKSSKGMGIGAHQVREFVRRMGGRVSVSSVLGEGTSFVISLPCKAEETMADAPGKEGVLGRP
ncbi:MAG: PEP-CTERM system histidine kinase PrsK, partial [Ectothiorhodospiraceae bacterium]|nr:PEP-CTERM system histidine kinase PrsK [Ectothiorhodospiraceae bacterium]